jgi:Na+:H+ antiporter, NhaA family
VGISSAVGRYLVEPIRSFVDTEVMSGTVLLAATVVALAWANSPWDGAYRDLFGHALTFDVGIVRIDEDLQHWINEGLMTLFFFVVALEIKREVVRGDLSGRPASLPIIAAVGGMAAPALIYAALNAGAAGAPGWGIPMATDIAFALGILALLGGRISPQLRVFLLALAIVDDIGAILVIAIFYSGDIQLDSLAIACGLLVLIFGMYQVGIRYVAVYFCVGAIVWLAVFESGIHATIAGVALGLMTPLEPVHVSLQQRVLTGFNRFRRAHRRTRPVSTDSLRSAEESGPLYRLEQALHPFTSFLVVPLFALANAGVALDPDTIRSTLTTSVTLGVALGLLIGKPLGIVVFTWLACRLGVSSLPSGTTFRQILGIGMLAGVGFTVALFVNQLAFDSEVLVEQGKIGILGGSLAAGLLGFLLLRTTTDG